MTLTVPPAPNAVFHLGPVVEITDGGSPDGLSELIFVSLIRVGSGRVVEERCRSYADARRAARRALQRTHAVAIIDLTDWGLPCP